MPNNLLLCHVYFRLVTFINITIFNYAYNLYLLHFNFILFTLCNIKCGDFKHVTHVMCEQCTLVKH